MCCRKRIVHVSKCCKCRYVSNKVKQCNWPQNVKYLNTQKEFFGLFIADWLYLLMVFQIQIECSLAWTLHWLCYNCTFEVFPLRSYAIYSYRERTTIVDYSVLLLCKHCVQGHRGSGKAELTKGSKVVWHKDFN